MGHVEAAKYRVEEVISKDNYRQSFAIDINNAGGVIGSVRDSFNFPFYVENYLTADTSALRVNCGLSDAELTSGDFDSTSTQCLKSEFTSTSYASSPSFQKVGDYKSFYSLNGSTQVVNLFDFIDDDLGGYTRSNIEQLRASNANGIMVGFGTSPFSKITFQQTGEEAAEDPITLWQQDFSARAVAVVNNTVVELSSIESQYGGYSEAHDISDGNFIAGSQAISLVDGIAEELAEECTGALLPDQVCAWTYYRGGSFFNVKPVVWQIDDSGNVLNSVQYDLAFTPTEDQTGVYNARAVAINDLGIAVGYGSVPYEEGNTIAPDFPLVFQNGETKSLIDDRDDYHRGYAVDINNNNQIVGQLDVRDFSNTSGPYKSKFFIKNLDSGELVTPTTFFSTAESTASSINDNGLVVGQAEFETTQASTRRKHGFLYDSVNQQFFDLNDLTACESSYEIVETSSINNSGQIVATALKMFDLKDYKGQIITDPTTGEAYQEQSAVAVLLTPIEGGEIDECLGEEEVPYERKGLTLPVSVVLFLTGLIAIRRRFL